MFRRLHGLFQRYLAQHLILTRQGPALRDGQGQPLTEAAEITLAASRLRLRVRPAAGIAAPELWLVDGSGFRTRLMPEGHDPDAPLILSAAVPLRPGVLRLEEGEGGPSVVLPVPGRLAQGWGAALLLPRFSAGLLRALPLVLRWFRTGDLSLRPMIRATLGLSPEPRLALIDARLFTPPAQPPAPPVLPAAITILLPVYNSFDLLAEVIDRVETHTDLPWHLIAIEDASPDPRVRPWLRERLARLPEGHATLVENDANLGFIGSVNRGFALALQRGHPVVLLNSDAFVPQAWASRLVAPLMENPQIASVTPMSNDAELMTVPVICDPHPLAPGQGDALDAVARGFVHGAGTAEVPTGVGFCMALSAGWLARVPLFDTIFGRGYGEEVDWCQKVLALGGRHLGLPGLFVEHRGGASFGSAEKQALIAQNNRTVASRHPRFPITVQGFIAEDPLATPRLALAVAYAAGRTDQPLPLYVAHALGGGAEIWLQARIAADLAGLGAALVLRLGGPHRWRLELHLPGDPVQHGDSDDIGLIAALLAPVPRLHMVYSCAVGDPDPAGLPDALLRLLRVDDGLEVLFHDFFPISPSYTLLDSAGRFRGVPGVADTDAAHQTRRRDGTPVPLADWRAAWGRLAARADRLVTFSADSASHVAAAWPDLAARVALRPHALHTAVPRIAPPAAGQPFTVAVLGNIGFQKGITLVAALARRLETTPGAPSLVVIGNTDPAYPLPASLRVHGGYALADLPALAHAYHIGAWLIPSIWPETFSYTTHEALATGLPVVGLDLGAQGQALKAHPHGLTVPLADPDTMVQGLLDTLLLLPGARRA